MTSLNTPINAIVTRAVGALGSTTITSLMALTTFVFIARFF
jgi:hypothetical protein